MSFYQHSAFCLPALVTVPKRSTAGECRDLAAAGTITYRARCRNRAWHRATMYLRSRIPKGIHTTIDGGALVAYLVKQPARHARTSATESVTFTDQPVELRANAGLLFCGKPDKQSGESEPQEALN